MRLVSLLLLMVLAALAGADLDARARERHTRSVRDTLVHYVLPSGLECPALIVSVADPVTGRVNLTIFPDWSNDLESAGLAWQTNVLFNAGKQPGTWHRLEDTDR